MSLKCLPCSHSHRKTGGSFTQLHIQEEAAFSGRGRPLTRGDERLLLTDTVYLWEPPVFGLSAGVLFPTAGLEQFTRSPIIFIFKCKENSAFVVWVIQTNPQLDKRILMHLNCADTGGAKNIHIAHSHNVLSVLFLSQGYIFSQGRV